MNDERLRELLRALPRESASPGFTRRVLARAACEPAAGPRRWLPALAAAAAAAAALVIGIGVARLGGFAGGVDRPGGDLQAVDRPRAERLAELRLEKERLEREIALLSRLVEEPRPVLYLGGDESTDYVIDLAALASRHPAANLGAGGGGIVRAIDSNPLDSSIPDLDR